MRARELRLRRSLRGIVTMLAGPVAGIAACHAAANPDPEADAQAVDASHPALQDAGRVDASIARDATLGDSAAGQTSEADSWDPEACAAVTIDGAYIDNNPDGCSTFRRLPCGLPPLPPHPPGVSSQLEGCNVYLGTCAELGDTFTLFCLLAPPSCDEAGVRRDATSIVDCVGSCGIAGRPPRGLLASRTKSTPSVGDYFAAM